MANAPRVQVFGTVEPFNPATMDWDVYEFTFLSYLEANELQAPAPVGDGEAAPLDKRKALLCATIGHTASQVLVSLCAPQTPKDRTFEQLLEVLRTHYRPKKTTFASRDAFMARKQKDGESIQEYSAELRRLVMKCEFTNDQVEIRLIEQLTHGLSDLRIRRKAIEHLETAKAADRTFTNVVQFAQAIETFQKDLTSESAAKSTVNATTSKPSSSNSKSNRTVKPTNQPAESKRQSQGRGEGQRKQVVTRKPGPGYVCYRCGRNNHFANECYHLATTCRKCGKVGHTEKACRSKTAPSQMTNENQTKKSVNRVFKSDERKDFEFVSSISAVKAKTSASDPINVTLKVDSKDVSFQLDTGSPYTLVPVSLWHQFGKPNLEPSETLTACNFTSLTVRGEWTAVVQHRETIKQLRCIVVTPLSTALCGREWIDAFKLIDYSNVNTVQTISAGVHEKLDSILNEYKDLFEPGLGKLKNFKAHIYVKPDAQFTIHKPRPIAFGLRNAVDKELDRLLEIDVIEPVETAEFGAVPIVTVVKPGGAVRICADFKVGLNRYIDVQQYPLPHIDDLFATLAGGKHFSKVDLADAYLQVEVDEDSRKYLVITTHRGLFRYKRVPFGIASAVAIFQCAIETTVRGLQRTGTYLDDLLLTGLSTEEHLANLRKLFERFRSSGLRLKREKCAFLQDSLDYLGHTIDQFGIRPSQRKLDAILNAPEPADLQQLQSFLGLANYYRKFIPNFSTICTPLNALRKQGTTFRWTSECANAMTTLKQELVSPRILVHFDATKQLTLACDASNYGIGAVLSQIDDKGEEKPVAFASRTLGESEIHYSQLEKEGLAIVYGVDHFQKFLLGRKFILYTDHQPLQKLFNVETKLPPLAIGRVQRWAINLQPYNYEIRYRKGELNSNADALSRLPLPTSSSNQIGEVALIQSEFFEHLPISARTIAEETRKDPVLRKALFSTMYGWSTSNEDKQLEPYWTRRTELTTQSGCLLWGLRVVIPASLHQQVTELLHEAHVGVVRMKATARMHVWWPKMSESIEELAKKCYACAQIKGDPPKAPLHSWQWPERPWQRLHIDYAGPFLGRQFLIVVDAHSEFPYAIPVPDTTANVTIKELYALFSVHGLPDQIVSDNGAQFTSDIFSNFCRTLGVQHIRSAAYHPSTNGKAERFVRTFKTAMTAMKSEAGPLDLKLLKFLFRYRSTPHTTTGRTPAELLYGRPLRTLFDVLKPSPRTTVENSLARQQLAHNRSARERSFQVGDTVFVRSHGHGAKKWRAGTIVAIAGPLTYDIRIGNEVVRDHIDHLLLNHTNHRTDLSEAEESDALDLHLETGIPSTDPPKPLVKTLQDTGETSTPVPQEPGKPETQSLKSSSKAERTETLREPRRTTESSTSIAPPVQAQRNSTRERRAPAYFADEYWKAGSNK
jgi:hypothetical protein